MKIQKYQWGNPIEEWGSQQKERLQPSNKSKVIQKWNTIGKKPKPESSIEKARKQAQPQRTWRSDVADTFHNIGEGVLALSPYTAVPYYGAKVGQDFLNGNVGVHTALNVSVPLFHLNPNNIYNSGKMFLNNSLDVGNISYYLNKNKLINKPINIPQKVGSESEIYFNNGRVYKYSKSKFKTKGDAYNALKQRMFRNKNPYYIKERTEGITPNSDETYSIVTSQKQMILPKNSRFIDSPEGKLQEQLLKKKGYVRTPISIVKKLPGFSPTSAAYIRMGQSNVFNKGNNYMLDNTLGTNSFITKDGKLFNIDNPRIKYE